MNKNLTPDLQIRTYPGIDLDSLYPAHPRRRATVPSNWLPQRRRRGHCLLLRRPRVPPRPPPAGDGRPRREEAGGGGAE